MQSVPAGDRGIEAIDDLVAEAAKAGDAGELERAEGLLAEAARRAPEDPVVLHERGRLMMRRGHFDQAVDPLRRVVGADPGDADALADLGATLAALGDLNGGLDALEIAAALDEGNETAREGIAILRGLLGAPASGESCPEAEGLEAEGSAGVPVVLAPGRNVWFVGNSQLITSVLRACCEAEETERIGADWREKRVTRGTLTIDGEAGLSARYACCNMALLGNPAFIDGELRDTAGIRAFVDLVDDDATDIVVMLRGNEFAMEALVDSDPRWDFPYRDFPALMGRQFVAKSDALAHFAGVTNALLASCLVYRKAFPQARIYHVPAPPPIESEAHILANPEIFGALFSRHGIRPFPLRKKIYDAMYDGLSGRLREHGVATIPTPPECLTAAGGLRAEHAHGCLHGNDRYGRALIATLRGE